MLVPTGRKYTRETIREVRFACRRCGYRGNAEVTGVGEGVESFLNSPGTGADRAERDARRDIGRVLKRAPCRKCGKRPAGAAISFLFSNVVSLVAFGAVVGIVVGWAPTWLDLQMRDSDKAALKWPSLIVVSTIFLVVAGLRARVRWSMTDTQIEWLDSERLPLAPRHPYRRSIPASANER